MLSDQTNYLMSLKRSSLYDGDIVLSCHRQAHIGQQKSVIMIAKRKTRDDEKSQTLLEAFKDNHGSMFAKHEQESEDDQTRKSQLKMYIENRSFVEYTLTRQINKENEVDKTLNSIDIKEIKNLYTIEQRSNIQFLGQTFLDKWCEVRDCSIIT